MTTMTRRLASKIALFGAVLRAFAGLGHAGRNVSLLLALAPVPALAAEAPANVRRPLVLLVSRFDNPQRDFAAITLASMCQQAGVDFDAYYAADHQEGGLFSAHGSSVIGGGVSQPACSMAMTSPLFRPSIPAVSSAAGPCRSRR